MGRAKKKRQFEVPKWAEEPGKAVWVEITNDEGEPQEYIPGSIVSYDPKSKQCKIKYNDDRKSDDVDGDKVLQMNLDPPYLSDLCDVQPLNNAELLLNLEKRYKNDDIFCDCGPTLLCINPNKFIKKLYTDEQRDDTYDWAKCLHNETPVPHIWTLSAKAYRQMFEHKKKQATCISGESGAGKTYNTRAVMAFITQLMQDPKDSSETPIEDRIFACNPILEAFGNATTVRNDDSSRFGKYFEMWVDTSEKVIKGASINNYLLEKSRISYQAKTERNYHVFYALATYCSDDDREKLFLNNDGKKCKIDKFKYCSMSGRTVNDKVDDKEFYEGIEAGFKRLNFTEDERFMVWSMVSAVLQIGNLSLDKGSYVESEAPCQI